MGKVISKEKFEEIMEDLQEKNVWLNIGTNTVRVNVIYPEFEFLIFKNGKYQFGVKDYDEESIIQIKKDDIEEIHRNEFAPTTDDEEIILNMVDGTEIFVRLESVN